MKEYRVIETVQEECQQCGSIGNLRVEQTKLCEFFVSFLCPGEHYYVYFTGYNPLDKTPRIV